MKLLKIINLSFCFWLVLHILCSCTDNDANYSSLEDHDGNIYKTIKIGKQTWMAENFKSTTFINGVVISSAIVFDNNFVNIKSFGLMYSKSDVYNILFCPDGWRLPSNEDFIEMLRNVGIEESKDTIGFYRPSYKLIDGSKYLLWNNPADSIKQKNASLYTNNSGFNALPGGVESSISRFSSGICSYIASTIGDSKPTIIKITPQGIYTDKETWYGIDTLRHFYVRLIKK
ncbi:MAG: FISUMP domain-containing protein [Paludibacter sp.]|nr:FISUMP domain-containing protein [Paludibacter sp.]